MAVPALTPETIPPVPTVAFALLLLQVPPDVASESVMVPPVATTSAPDIGAGPRDTVTTVVAKQLPTKHDITVVPAAAPVTNPPELIVAIPTSELVQVTPPTASLNDVVPPEAQTAVLPSIVVGVEFTVTT